MSLYRSDVRALQAQAAMHARAARELREYLHHVRPDAPIADVWRAQCLRAQREAATYALWALLAID